MQDNDLTLLKQTSTTGWVFDMAAVEIKSCWKHELVLNNVLAAQGITHMSSRSLSSVGLVKSRRSLFLARLSVHEWPVKQRQAIMIGIEED